MRERPLLEYPAFSPFDVLELEGGWAEGTGMQEGAMIQRCPKIGNSLKLGETCERWHSPEGTCDTLQAMDNPILGGRRRNGGVLMSKLGCILDCLAPGICIDQLEAMVGVKGRANVGTLLCMEIPGTLSDRLCMNEDATTNWAKQRLVEVEGTLEKIPRTDSWVKQCLVEKIEGELGLWKEKAPKVRGKCRINTGQNCKELVLECVKGVFHLVAVMYVRQDKLELGMPLDGDNFLLSCTGLIVKDLEINCKTLGCQA